VLSEVRLAEPERRSACSTVRASEGASAGWRGGVMSRMIVKAHAGSVVDGGAQVEEAGKQAVQRGGL